MAKKKQEAPKTDVETFEINGRFYPTVKKNEQTLILSTDGIFYHEGYEQEGFESKEAAQKAFEAAEKTLESYII